MKRWVLIAGLCVSSSVLASGSAYDADDYIIGTGIAAPLDSEAFVSGRLGILSSNLWPRWRGVAYRVIAGPSLDAVTALALQGGPLHDDKAPDPARDWLAARARIATATAARLPNVTYGYDYGNCYADAFATATVTLQKRVERYGANSRDVAEWLAGQDAVFSNCDGTGAMPPDKVGIGVAPAIQKDRDYQIAAALFYAAKWAESRAAFARIAADKTSDWAGYGQFVVARAMLRQATATEQSDVALLGQAEQELQRVLADPRANALHASARRLLRFIAFRTRPIDQFNALGAMLERDSGPELQSILTDFAWLGDKRTSPVPRAEVEAARKKSELAEWTLAWQLAPENIVTYALARYREKRAVPWLVLAIAEIPPGHSEARALLESARTVKPGSPAYLHVAYHRARILIGQKRLPAARALLDELLPQRDLPYDVYNGLADLRFGMAETITEALPYLMRKDGRGSDQLSPAGMSLFLQYVPMAESFQYADDKSLQAAVRHNVRLAVFYRAALLDDVALAKRALAAVEADDPQLTKGLAEWAAAATPEQRRYELVRDGLRRGWKLSLSDGYGPCGASSPALGEPNTTPPSGPAFVDAALQKKALAESRKLDALLGNPATFRATQTASWAETHKKDPRVPEDLHLAVIGTKHACDGSTATAASKRAWKVLHKLFPNDDFTKQTKYWYP